MSFAKFKTMALLCAVAAVSVGAGGFVYQAPAQKGSPSLADPGQDPGRPTPDPDERKGGADRRGAERTEAQPNDEPQQTDPDLPRDAGKRIKEFEAEAETIRKKADAEIQALREKLLPELEALQESYTKAGKLDEAVAIRGRIRQLKADAEKDQSLLGAAKERAHNLLVNGSFEDGPELPKDGVHNAAFHPGSTGGKDWVVTRGIVAYSDSTYWRPAHGKRSISLTWQGGDEGAAISQSFKTRKGQKYRATFWLAADPHGGPMELKLQLSVAGKSAEFSFDRSGKNRVEMGWVKKTLEFVAQSDQTTIEFAGLTRAGGYGPALDDVVVVPVKE
jgi:choice-of-anchor C domain-containing protein